MSDRVAAWRVLQRVEKEGAYASLLLEQHDDFVRHLVLGVLRWRGRLDAIAGHLANRTTAQVDQPALQLLRIGIYQLAWMNVPDHAAVSETMRAASVVAPRAKPFINAVLRRAARMNVADYDPPQTSEPKRLAFRYSHPLWLVERWTAAFGTERAERILAANQEYSWPDLLVNENRLSSAEAEAGLKARGVAVEPSPLSRRALRLRESTRAIAEELAEGLVYPIDEASVAVASLLRARPALDIAAAPGGKSLVLALDGGRIVSHDISLRRLLPLRESFRRFFGKSAPLVIGDGGMPPFRAGSFRGVLLDAPCSATGIIRKNPEIKWRLQPGDIGAFAQSQRSILSGALSVGAEEILYVTCSLEREENDDVCASLEGTGYERGDLRDVAPAELRPWIDGGVLRLTPESGADGFTATLLRRAR